MAKAATLGMLKKDEQWDEKKTPTWLYETLRRLVEGQKDSQRGLAAVNRGETPDGSGNSLIDSSLFLFKPGLPGNQIAFGGTGAGGTLTLSSTKHSTKGFIYFGISGATRIAFDESNCFLGIGTDVPNRRL